MTENIKYILLEKARQVTTTTKRGKASVCQKNAHTDDNEIPFHYNQIAKIEAEKYQVLVKMRINGDSYKMFIIAENCKQPKCISIRMKK